MACGEQDRALPGLSVPFALIRILDAVVHRVAYQVDEGISELLYDRLVEFGLRAFRGEFRFLAELEGQIAHNAAHGIQPRAIVKQVKDLIDGVYSEKAGKEAERLAQDALQRAKVADMSEKDMAKEIKRLEKQMLEHARNLEFEQAARVRDQLALLKDRAFGAHGGDVLA